MNYFISILKDLYEGNVVSPFIFAFYCILIISIGVVLIKLLYFVLKQLLKRKESFFDLELRKHPDAEIKYYVSWLDDSGRDIQDWFNDKSSAEKEFDKHVKLEDDVQLYKAILRNVSGENEILHDEVIDSWYPRD